MGPSARSWVWAAAARDFLSERLWAFTSPGRAPTGFSGSLCGTAPSAALTPCHQQKRVLDSPGSQALPPLGRPPRQAWPASGWWPEGSFPTERPGGGASLGFQPGQHAVPAEPLKPSGMCVPSSLLPLCSVLPFHPGSSAPPVSPAVYVVMRRMLLPKEPPFVFILRLYSLYMDVPRPGTESEPQM